MSPKLITVSQLAERYSVHSKTIRKWANCGILPVIRINSRCLRFDVEECDAVIRRRTKGVK